MTAKALERGDVHVRVTAMPADTNPAGDLRIQNLAARADGVLQRGVAKTGTAEADILRGTAFGDRLDGGAGDDTIYNSPGDDILIGGAGPGGAIQNDTLIFATALADAGHDVQALIPRRRGRPGRAAKPSHVVTLRLTSAELALVDAHAEREHKSRSQVIREALAES
jgi:hypothetical protein